VKYELDSRVPLQGVFVIDLFQHGHRKSQATDFEIWFDPGDGNFLIGPKISQIVPINFFEISYLGYGV
jgi:hypothetical protein